MNKTQIFWDKQANKFDDNEKQFEDSSNELIARTKDYLGSNDNVLDFGCATGSKTLELAAVVKHIHGLDISPSMITEAKKKIEKFNVKNVSFSQGTIFSDDLEKASFEKITAYAIIHLLNDSEEVIERVHELLKPGGLFISATACFKEKMDFKTRFEFTVYHVMKHLGIFPLHLNLFRSSDVEQLINRHNFNIVKAEKLFFNGMTISFIVSTKQ